jgi:hypothetical protein
MRELLAMPDTSFTIVTGILNREFGTSYTRNSVISKANRVGNVVRSNHRRPCAPWGSVAKHTTPKPRYARKDKPARHNPFVARPEHLPEFIPVITIEVDPALHRDLIEIGDGCCRQPMGEGMYCGSPVIARRASYCSIHSAINTRPTPMRRNVNVHRYFGERT